MQELTFGKGGIICPFKTEGLAYPVGNCLTVGRSHSLWGSYPGKSAQCTWEPRPQPLSSVSFLSDSCHPGQQVAKVLGHSLQHRRSIESKIPGDLLSDSSVINHCGASLALPLSPAQAVISCASHTSMHQLPCGSQARQALHHSDQVGPESLSKLTGLVMLILPGQARPWAIP